MSEIIETIPNFSEGRRNNVLNAIKEAFNVEGLNLLEYSADADHNRSVYTAAGNKCGIEEGLIRAIRCARDMIDLREHKGEHPRIGAADVVPLVPIEGISIEQCIELSHHIGKRIGDELDIPVYMYEMSAADETRRNLADIRAGGFEGLQCKMQQPSWKPDYGKCKPHVSAGAVVLGVRKPLIAYNLLLDTHDINIAKTIAGNIRERGGGLKTVKALGMSLETGAQVSVNITDYEVNGLFEVYTAVDRLCREAGCCIASTELIGLVPSAAMADAAAKFLHMGNYTVDKVLDFKIKS